MVGSKFIQLFLKFLDRVYCNNLTSSLFHGFTVTLRNLFFKVPVLSSILISNNLCTDIAFFHLIIVHASIRSPLVLLRSKFVNPHLVNPSSYAKLPPSLIILFSHLCIRSNVSMFDEMCLASSMNFKPYTVGYSRCGLTSDLYSQTTTSWSLLTVTLLLII